MKMNLDGVDGKLYQGRLELFKTDYHSGRSLVEQAVAQQEDYALGHLILCKRSSGRKTGTEGSRNSRR